ncbi:MAG: tetratricopeptide repeat protein [Pseudomonadota bacterium]
MTNDESLIREVDEGLAEDDFWRTLQSRGPFILAGAAAIVLGVAGFQVMDARRAAAAGDAAERYFSVITAEEATGAERFERLRRFEEDAPEGYSVVARFRIAASLAARGDVEEARVVYRSIYDGDAAPKRLRQLARLRAAHIALDADRDAVIEAVGDLETDESQFGYFAREALAFAALKAGDYASAAATFSNAASDPAAPEGVKTRAREFAALAEAAAVGDGLEWPKQQSAADLIRSLGAQLPNEADAPTTEEGALDATDEPAADGPAAEEAAPNGPATDGDGASSADADQASAENADGENEAAPQKEAGGGEQQP